MYYILKGHDPISCDNIHEFGKWFDKTDNRIVKKTKVGDMEVSTVFLGIEHGLDEMGAPILFETMVFDKDNKEKYCERYSTWDEAEKGHDFMVVACEKGEIGPVPISKNGWAPWVYRGTKE